MKRTRKAFTLIELLVVIGIIGILAAIIFVALTQATKRSKRASALSTASSMMAELNICNIDGGTGLTGSIPDSNKFICASDKTGSNAFDTSHTLKWPVLQGSATGAIGTTGWSFGKPSGLVADASYTYTVTTSGDSITCTLATSACK